MFTPYITIAFADEIEMGFNMCTITPHANFTGHPALSIPCGQVEGLPVGLMIVGKHYDDQTVLDVAFTYEGIRDEKRKSAECAA